MQVRESPHDLVHDGGEHALAELQRRLEHQVQRAQIHVLEHHSDAA